MRTLRLTDNEFNEIRMRLASDRAAQMDAARQADKKGKGLGDGWREQAERTRQLLSIMDAAGNK